MSESNFAKLRRRCSGGGVEERRGSQAEAELVVQALLLFGVSVFFFWFPVLYGFRQRKPYL